MANTYKFNDYLHDPVVHFSLKTDTVYPVQLSGSGIEAISFQRQDGYDYAVVFHLDITGTTGKTLPEAVYDLISGSWIDDNYRTFTADAISSSYIKTPDGTDVDSNLLEWILHNTHVISQIDPPTTTTYTVTFNVQGHGTAPSTQTITSGNTVSRPTNPTASGYRFSGWYNEPQCINSYNFSARVYSDLTLYAKWVELGAFAYVGGKWNKISASVYKRVNGTWNRIT